MKKISLLPILLFLFSFPISAQELESASPEEVGVSSDRINRLTNVMQEYVDQNKMSGAVALVARKNKIIYYNAVGKSDLENDRMMNKDAIFRIASQTKAIVSVGIMILQEEGKLLISDPLSKFIPEFKESTVAVSSDDGNYKIVKSKRETCKAVWMSFLISIGRVLARFASIIRVRELFSSCHRALRYSNSVCVCVVRIQMR